MTVLQPSKNQISFWTQSGGDAASFAPGSAGSFIDGFFPGRVFPPHLELKKYFDDTLKRNIILELPPFAGKTTGAFFAAFLTAFEFGKNALLVYPSPEKRATAQKYLEFELEKRQYHRYELLCELNHKSFVTAEQSTSPQIYLTDVFSLHTNLLPRFKNFYFWHLMGLVALEDVDCYTYTFGANCAYLFRRLFARLQAFDATYKALCTCNPIENRREFISRLTSIEEKEFSEIINIKGAESPPFEVMHWYPPVSAVSYLPREHFRLEKNNFVDELRELIRFLLSNRKCVALLWSKTPVNEDDLANITAVESSQNQRAQLFSGRSLDRIRSQLLEKDMDWDHVDTFLIVGYSMPVRQYMQELRHMGISGGSPNLMIIYDKKNAGLQWEALDLLTSSKEQPFGGLTSRNIEIDISSDEIMVAHASRLSEENPDIDFERVKELFPETFVRLMRNGGAERKSSRFIFLNYGINFFPKSRRKESELYASETGYDLIENQQKLGFLPSNRVMADCFPRAILIYQDNNYRVLQVNHDNQQIILERFRGTDFICRLADYVISKEERLENIGLFQGHINVSRIFCTVSEKFIGTLTISNFEESVSDLKDSENGFPEANISGIRVDFSESDFSALLNSTSINPDNTPIKLNDFSFKILHTISHLLIEAARTEVALKIQDVQIVIQQRAEQVSEAGGDRTDAVLDEQMAFTRLYFLDISGNNIDFRNLFSSEGFIIGLLKKSYAMLTECPCHDGSGACIRHEFCNIPHCSQKLDKFGTMRFLGMLLGENGKIIDASQSEAWKTGADVRDNKGQLIHGGVFAQPDVKINRMSDVVKAVITNKGCLSIAEWYREDFMDAAFLAMQTGFCTGYTDPRNKIIHYRPGLIESLLYETMFHERFYNYQNMAGTFSSELKKFNWDDIDDQANIPYGGQLIVEGSATWFSMRMMEFFDMLDYMANIGRSHALQYRAGLLVMLKLEAEVGFEGVLQELKNGFEVTKFKQEYEREIISARDRYVNLDGTDAPPAETPQDAGEEPDEVTGEAEMDRNVTAPLVCLRPELNPLTSEDHYTNLQRLSFFQYHAARGDIIFEKAIAELSEGTCAHVPINELRRLACMRTSEQFLAFLRDLPEYNVVDRILAEMGIFGNIEEGNSLLCQSCRSNCPLLLACMLRGGRKWFEKIVCAIHPPPPPPRVSLWGRIMLWIRMLCQAIIRTIRNLFGRR